MFEESVKTVPLPAGQAGAGVETAELDVTGAVDVRLPVAEADIMEDVSVVGLGVVVPVDSCVVDVESVLPELEASLSVDVAEAAEVVLDVSPSGHVDPGSTQRWVDGQRMSHVNPYFPSVYLPHGSTEQHPLNPFAQL